MSVNQSVIVLDFGSQYSQLIARRIRECNVYSKIVSFKTSADEIRKEKPAGIIFSGGPASVYQDDAPKCDPEIFKLGIPILGICYGLQMTSHLLGGKVIKGTAREFGRAELEVLNDSELFAGLDRKLTVWMSHGDKVLAVPEGFSVIARTSNTEFAAVSDVKRKIFGIQFHPEVVHTPKGKKIIENF